jgi:phosphatidylinositol alpha-1,6-mannosyltransferase
MQIDKSALEVLLVTRNLPPLVGGMERLMQNLAAGVSQYAKLTVIGPRGCSQYLPSNTRVLEVPDKLGPFLMISTWLAIRECHRGKFDTVIGGSGLIAPTLGVLSTLFSCKTVIYLHGLDLIVNNLLYQDIFVPCIRRVDRLVVNSVNTRKIALAKGIKSSQTTIVNPGTDIPNIPSDTILEQFRYRHEIRFQKVLLFVGRMTKRKGLSGFVRNSLPRILEAEPTAGLVVVGKNPEDSLNQLGEEKAVLAAVADLKLQDRVTFLGQVTDDALLASYAIADVQIFPLVEVEGDVEGFGMVAIEAAALGTPTIAFDAGGVADAISTRNGFLVKPGDYQTFADLVVHVLRKKVPSHEDCIKHAKEYCWDKFHERFRHVLVGDSSGL